MTGCKLKTRVIAATYLQLVTVTTFCCCSAAPPLVHTLAEMTAFFVIDKLSIAASLLAIRSQSLVVLNNYADISLVKCFDELASNLYVHLWLMVEQVPGNRLN